MKHEPYLYIKIPHFKLPPGIQLGDSFHFSGVLSLTEVSTRIGGVIEKQEATITDVKLVPK